MVAAEVCGGREKPRSNIAVGPQPHPLLIEPHERLGGHVARIGLMMEIAPRKSIKRPLPSRDEPVKRAIVSRLQGEEVS
jgi:hypothetical protein